MTILAAIDGVRSPDPVVSVGYDLATAFDERLFVLHVVPEREFDEYREELAEHDDSLDFSFTQHESSIARFAGDIVEDTLDGFDPDLVETVGRIGAPVSEVLAEAAEVDARFVVIGGRRRSPAGKAVFGSTTQDILLDADWPVVTVMEPTE